MWHDFGMEWKEHVGWLVPFLATAVAFIVLRHRRLLAEDQHLRTGVTNVFTLVSAVAVVLAEASAGAKDLLTFYEPARSTWCFGVATSISAPACASPSRSWGSGS